MPLSGTVSRQVSLHRPVSGTLGTLSGAVSKKVQVSTAGVLGTLSGSLAGSLEFPESVSGTLGSLTGSLSRQFLGKRSPGGTLTMTGSLSRTVNRHRSVAGTLSFTGSVMDNLLETFQKSVSGTLGALTGAVAKTFYKGGVRGGWWFRINRRAKRKRRL